jgi:L-ascorbate metabolism protein UlaG (beta-lactamase superfamily)
MKITRILAFTLLFAGHTLYSQIMNIHSAGGQVQKFKVSDVDSITFSSEAGALTWIGHASVKIKTNDGTLIYIDPYYGTDYSEPADIILVTHGHNDHNQVNKVTKKEDCQIFSGNSANVGGTKMSAGDSVEVRGIKIKAVEAYNSNHAKGTGVGFVLQIADVKVYHAGDTAKIPEMEALAALHIDYALLPIDGVYNMSPEAATEAVELIKPKKAIPIHQAPPNATPEQKQKNVDKFTPPNRLIMKEGDTIYL